MRFIALLSLLMLAACAHQAPLKTPSQAAAAQKKAEAKAARDAEKKAKQAEAAPAPKDDNNSQEVTVP